MPEFIPRVNLPTGLAELKARLAAQSPLAQAITSVGQSLGGALQARGKARAASESKEQDIQQARQSLFDKAVAELAVESRLSPEIRATLGVPGPAGVVPGIKGGALDLPLTTPVGNQMTTADLATLIGAVQRGPSQRIAPKATKKEQEALKNVVIDDKIIAKHGKDFKSVGIDIESLKGKQLTPASFTSLLKTVASLKARAKGRGAKGESERFKLLLLVQPELRSDANYQLALLRGDLDAAQDIQDQRIELKRASLNKQEQKETRREPKKAPPQKEEKKENLLDKAKAALGLGGGDQDMVLVKLPNGSTVRLPRKNLEKAKARGAVEVQ